MSDYETRHQAVTDATRLVRELHEVAEQTNPQTFSTVKITRPPLDLLDVLEVARFLLDEEDDGVPPGPCGVESASFLNSPPSHCSLLAGHAGEHKAADGMTWGLG